MSEKTTENKAKVKVEVTALDEAIENLVKAILS